MYVCMYVYIHTYIHTYVRTYIYIYIYIYTHRGHHLPLARASAEQVLRHEDLHEEVQEARQNCTFKHNFEFHPSGKIFRLFSIKFFFSDIIVGELIVRSLHETYSSRG